MDKLIPKCRNCGANQKFQKVRADFVYGGSNEHKFWRCGECDLVYLNPPLSKKEEKKFYANEFENFIHSLENFCHDL